MRWIHGLIAGLLIAGSIPCHIALAQPGHAAPGAHGAVPGHADEAHPLEPDACDWVGVLHAPSETVTAPQPVTPLAALTLPGAVWPPRPQVSSLPAVLPVSPVTPVHRHVVLVI